MHPVEDLERFPRENKPGSSTAAVAEIIGKIRPTGREKNTSDAIPSMAKDLAAVEAARHEKNASAP